MLVCHISKQIFPYKLHIIRHQCFVARKKNLCFITFLTKKSLFLVVFIAFSLQVVLGTLLAALVPVVGFNAVMTSEHFASFLVSSVGTMILLFVLLCPFILSIGLVFIRKCVWRCLYTSCVLFLGPFGTSNANPLFTYQKKKEKKKRKRKCKKRKKKKVYVLDVGIAIKIL